RVSRVGQGRADCATGLQHRLDAVAIEVVGVEDQIDAAAGGIERRLAAARVGHGLFAETMDLADYCLGFLLGEGGDQLAVLAALYPVERDLEAVDAVLDLAADFFDRFGDGGDELSNRGFR